MRKLLSFSMVLLAAFIAFTSFYFVYELPQRELRIRHQESIRVVVRPGSNLRTVLNELKRDEIIKYPSLIRLYARLHNQTQIKRGEYIIKRETTVQELLDKLNAGDIAYQSFTLIEGWNLAQVSDQLNKHFGRVSDSVYQPSRYGLEYSSIEGWIFPDTYFYSAEDQIDAILTQAVAKTKALLQQQWQLKNSGLPYANMYEMLIMASLIEKETAVDAERELIASVFINRLRKGMKLQTDPTVIYALGDLYDGNIRRRHLKYDSPFNTYVYKGLPPTPIAMPSFRSIQAAAKPATSSYLYFVAKGNGEHKFSVTLEEHNSAVDRYQRYSRSENYRSSPDK